MKYVMRALFALSLVASATQLSCSINDYCIQCATDDGGMGSGTGDADDGGGMGSDADDGGGCVPTGPEECDGKDNNCNGLIDEGNMPGVGVLCSNQMGVCAGGLTICQNGTIKCDKAGSPEVCNGLDDNCNGTPDEGNPGGGAKCGTDLGECVAGQYSCNATTGMLECFGFIDHTGDAEICDSKDNDCDGNFDEGLTNIDVCGPMANVGECKVGHQECQGGSQICVGAVFPKFEICNNKDDDCDTNVDEIFNKQTDVQNCGTCGNVCMPTSKTCINTNNNTNGATCMMDAQCPGGSCVVNSQPRCVTGGCSFACNVGFQNLDNNATNGCEYRCFATGAEECDGIDNDCDGKTDETLTPPAICLSGGECGATAPAAQCTGAGGWTCTYPGAVQFPETLCDGKNNDCDANTDEAQPNLNQACSDTAETVCTGAVDEDKDGFVNDGCPQVGMAPETGAQCADAIDNDNDGFVNDGCPAVAEQGVCKSFGTYQCSTTNPNGPAACTITTPGQAPAAQETCDDKDNDCDGKTDEGGTSGNLLGQEWVDLGGGKQMMKYEASKPDSTATDQGARNTIACSKQNVQPWTNVTYLQALAACQSIGASLCGESTWHRACSVATPAAYAANGLPTTSGTFIEAEDYSSIAFGQLDLTPESGANCNNATDDDGDGFVNDGCPANGTAETLQQCANNKDDDGDGVVNDGCPARGQTRSWVPDYTSTFSGVSALAATPNAGTTVTSANATTQASRVDYKLDIQTIANNWHVWVRMYAISSNDNQVYVGLNTAVPPTAPTVNNVSLGTNNAWTWVDFGTFNVTATGTRYLSIYMADDGTKIDQIYLVTGNGNPPNTTTSKGNKWAYATAANVYSANTCNGDDYDTDPVLPGDQDDILKSGSLANCKSTTGGGIFDMSGNVKEWTLAHAPGENPIRGGASNNTADGISCPLNFTLADDAFFFPNIGFRCCR